MRVSETGKRMGRGERATGTGEVEYEAVFEKSEERMVTRED